MGLSERCSLYGPVTCGSTALNTLAIKGESGAKLPGSAAAKLPPWARSYFMISGIAWRAPDQATLFAGLVGQERAIGFCRDKASRSVYN